MRVRTELSLLLCVFHTLQLATAFIHPPPQTVTTLSPRKLGSAVCGIFDGFKKITEIGRGRENSQIQKQKALAVKPDGTFDGFKKNTVTGFGREDTSYQKQKVLNVKYGVFNPDGISDGFKKSTEAGFGREDAPYQKQKAVNGKYGGFNGFKKAHGREDIIRQEQETYGREEAPGQEQKTLVAKPDITEDEVRELFFLWESALATGDSKKVADRYARNSVLLPTVSGITDYSVMEDYYSHFCRLKPRGKIIKSNVVIGMSWAQDFGIYEFIMGVTGKKVKGRYSFIYVYEDDEWKISHHHSIVIPEGNVTDKIITEEAVRALFKLWNDALAANDPKQMASLYSKQAVLIPTVSDVPRTDYYGILDYFTNFLKHEPQGEILNGNIIIGTNWAQDTGDYEFTMGATGDKVKERYTFLYVFENNEWKISQHHSIVMPEESKPQPINEVEVRNLFQLWNSALETEDPDAVASRYAKEPFFLPAVSDVPRTNYASIKDYFVGFLKKRPRAEILNSNVTIGQTWCQDAGIYKFTMGGTIYKGRYTFVYVWEEGEWKISQHHSSVMPEKFR